MTRVPIGPTGQSSRHSIITAEALTGSTTSSGAGGHRGRADVPAFPGS